MRHSTGLFGKLPANCIIQFPSGRWGFVGSVNISLGYLYDGQPITTEEQAKEAAKWIGIPFQKRTTTRAWETKKAAEEAAASLGFQVTQVNSTGKEVAL